MTKRSALFAIFPRSKKKNIFGHALKTVHLGCNSGVPDSTIIDFHQNESSTLENIITVFVKNMERSSTKDLLPSKVTFNGKSIHAGVQVIAEVYQIFDNSEIIPIDC